MLGGDSSLLSPKNLGGKHIYIVSCCHAHPSIHPSTHPSTYPRTTLIGLHGMISSNDVRALTLNTPLRPVPSRQPANPASPHTGRTRRPSRWIHQPSRASRPPHPGWGSNKVGPAPGRGYPQGFDRFDPPRRQTAVEGQGGRRSVRHLGHGCCLKHARPNICRLVVRCIPLGDLVVLRYTAGSFAVCLCTSPDLDVYTTPVAGAVREGIVPMPVLVEVRMTGKKVTPVYSFVGLFSSIC